MVEHRVVGDGFSPTAQGRVNSGGTQYGLPLLWRNLHTVLGGQSPAN